MGAQKRMHGKVALAVLLVVMVLVLGTLGFLVLQLLGRLQVNPGYIPADYGALVDEPEDASFETLYDITDAADLQGFLYQWWHNGGDEMIRYSRDVVNVLLIGVDGGDGQSGRSDAMMLASVNKRTRRITLLSFLRDSYCCFEVNGQAHYNRLNSAYHFGGAAGLMQAVSRLYKIRVDRYIAVNFKSFPALIDALGGVVVEVTQREARYINRTAPSWKGTFPAGEAVRLTGLQALTYSRIRKLDGDAERTGRQQKVIESILESASEAGLFQIYRALDISLRHVQTNYSRTELLGLIPSAASWVNFGVDKMLSPLQTGPESSAVGGTISGMSILIVDYPKAARQVQLALYGESNIDLAEDAHRNEYIEGLFSMQNS